MGRFQMASLVFVSKFTNELASMKKKINFYSFLFIFRIIEACSGESFLFAVYNFAWMLGCARVNFIIRRHANLRDE